MKQDDHIEKLKANADSMLAAWAEIEGDEENRAKRVGAAAMSNLRISKR